MRIPSCVGIAHGEHFAECVVGNRRRERGSACGRVFDAAQADIGVAARDRLIDGGEGDEDESGLTVEATRDQVGDLDIEADEL